MQQNRLRALDGIRGIAIFLVIWNHIPLGVLYQKLPTIVHPFLTMLLVNGKTGVSLLFLLSGFLMMWLHPQPKTIPFLKKRYLRIFPPFLTMVVSLAIIRSFKLFLPKSVLITMSIHHSLFGLFAVAITFTVAALVYGVWKLCATLNNKNKLPIGNILFFGFLAIQVGVALWYVFFLLHVPPAQFYMQWSLAAQAITTAIINATLTLPFGFYIAQLDGVYWTLITETFFYLMYPILVVHLVAAVRRENSRLFNILLTLAALPFFFGLKLVSERVLGFSIMQIQLFIYFLAGVALAVILKGKHNWKQQAIKKLEVLKRPWVGLICLFLIVGSVLLYANIPNFYHPWVQLFWIFPLTGMMFVALFPGSSFGKWLEQPFLITLGKYSYSLYLIHSLVVEMFTRGKEPTTLWSATLLIVAVWVGSLVLARCLYAFVEAPYFSLRKTVATIPTKSKTKTKAVLSKPLFPVFSLQTTRLAIVSLTIAIVLLVYIGYRSPFAFFTQSTSHSNLPFQIRSANPILIPITTQTLQFPFSATANNLGMISTSLRSGEVKDEHGMVNASDIPGLIEIRLIDQNGKKLFSTQYKVHEIGESRYHPFGFPVIQDSQRKKYTVEYQIVQPDPSRSLSIVATDAQFTTIYFPNKKQLLTQPKAFFDLALNKISEPFTKSTTWYAIFHLAPFLGVLWIGLFWLNNSNNGKIRPESV